VVAHSDQVAAAARRPDRVDDEREEEDPMTTSRTTITRCSAQLRQSRLWRPGPAAATFPPRRRLLAHLRSELGAATAEYAIVIMAAVGFAGVLLAVMRSDEVRAVLSELVRSALSVG
jgi:hypothetical protein